MATFTAPSSVHLQIERREQTDGSVALGLAGELDLESGAMLASALREPQNTSADRLVLDLSGVEFIDSSGISVLVHAHLEAQDEHRQLVLINLPRSVERVFAVSGVSSHFTIT